MGEGLVNSHVLGKRPPAPHTVFCGPGKKLLLRLSTLGIYFTLLQVVTVTLRGTQAYRGGIALQPPAGIFQGRDINGDSGVINIYVLSRRATYQIPNHFLRGD